MKTMSLTCTALLLCVATAEASVVIDDFSTPSQTIVAGSLVDSLTATGGIDIASTRTVSAIGASSTVYGGGNFSLSTFGSGAGVSFLYEFSGGTIDFTDPTSNVFAANIFGAIGNVINGTYTTSVELFEGGTGGTVATASKTFSAPGGIGGSAPNITGFSGPATGIDMVDAVRITVLTSTATPSVFNTGAAGASFAAAPEPASIFLLGLTGLGGFVIHRRRRAAEQTVAA